MYSLLSHREVGMKTAGARLTRQALLLVIAVSFSSYVRAESPGYELSAIADSGETVLTASRVGAANITVTVSMRSMDAKLSTSELLNVLPCTGSKTPCTLVDSLRIVVDERALFVPRSIRLGLADLSSVELFVGSKNENSKVVLYGGDAAEAYFVVVTFSSTRVLKKAVYSALLPDDAVEESVYHSLPPIGG
jgi:hypothetical protein